MKTASFEVVTPLKAQAYLQLNTNNRNQRAWWVQTLADSIKRGEWQCSHQGIAISESGWLLDGQHRLRAIVLADSPVEMLVVKGLPDDTQKVMDYGIKRTLSDLTGIDSKISQVLRYMAMIAYGDSVISAEQVLGLYNCGFGAIAEDLKAKTQASRATFSSASVKAGAILQMYRGQDTEYVKNVYYHLVHFNFAELPEIAQAFIRLADKLKFTQHQTFARALKVFDMSHQNDKLLRVGDKEAVSLITEARKDIKDANQVQTIDVFKHLGLDQPTFPLLSKGVSHE
jgi:hypothetical protein